MLISNDYPILDKEAEYFKHFFLPIIINLYYCLSFVLKFSVAVSLQERKFINKADLTDKAKA